MTAICAYCDLGLEGAPADTVPDEPTLPATDGCDGCGLLPIVETPMVDTERTLAWKTAWQAGEVA